MPIPENKIKFQNKKNDVIGKRVHFPVQLELCPHDQNSTLGIFSKWNTSMLKLASTLRASLLKHSNELKILSNWVMGLVNYPVMKIVKNGTSFQFYLFLIWKHIKARLPSFFRAWIFKFSNSCAIILTSIWSNVLKFWGIVYKA